MSENKYESRFVLGTTLFALITSVIGAYTIIFENSYGEPSFGLFLFYTLMGVLDLSLLFYFKLIKKVDFFSISLAVVYFVLSSSFILTQKDQFFTAVLLVPIFTFMNAYLTTDVLREHFFIRFILGGLYYVGGKFIAFFEYISSLIDSVRFGKNVSKSNASDAIKTGIIFIIIGLPVIFLIVNLLSASNDQFSKTITDLFDWHINFGINFGRAIFVIMVSLYLITDIYFLKIFERFETQVSKSINLQLRNVKNILRAGVLTVTILNIFYLFFIFIDLGQDFNNARNLLLSKGVNSYSEFAVGRFWELITISMINLVIFYVFTGFYKKLNTENSKVLKPFIATNLVILFINSLGLITSVHQRLSLYESGYGFTDKRLIAHLFIFVLAIVFVISLAAIFRVNHAKYQLASIAIVLLFLSFYTALPTDYFANKMNYELAKQGKIDEYDPTYASGSYYCITDKGYLHDFRETQSSKDSLIVANEIIKENKLTINSEDRKCLENSLESEKKRPTPNWREFNLANYVLRQNIK